MSRISKTVAQLCALVMLIAAVGFLQPQAAQAQKPDNTDKQEKIELCHYSADMDEHYLIEVSAKGTENGHGNHEHDVVYGTDIDGVAFTCEPEPETVVVDTDGDGIADSDDNCPAVANADQLDNYGSDAGDACEDTDGDGTPDVEEEHMCVSVDGTMILENGTATCVSYLASDPAKPNIATATGDGAEANAGIAGGDNNIATATGYNATAFAGIAGGDNNTATATGDLATAFAGIAGGDNNTATATGYNAVATAGMADGHSNTATATGDRAVAVAGWSGGYSNNTATADGDSAYANADALTGCTVTNGRCP